MKGKLAGKLSFFLIKILSITIFVWISGACNINTMNEWAAGQKPFPGVITIQNLNNGKSVYLSWEADANAESYRIMRAVNDGSTAMFTERKDGEDGYYIQGPTSAIDSTLEDDKGYFYRLDKRRNGEWTTGLEITAFSQTRPFPGAETPKVESFRADGNLLISWHYDEGADEYILMRSFDNTVLFSPPDALDVAYLGTFTEVYRGKGLQYLDKNVDPLNDERYVYKLYKERNGILYKWDKDIALGVAVKAEEDRHEPNNIEAEATLLETYRNANIYCYGFSLQNTFLEDIDWYKVNIPPGKVANMVIENSPPYTSPSQGYFLLYAPPFPTTQIFHGLEFQVRNDTDTQRYIGFAIIPNKSVMLTSGRGGMVIGYTIRWVSIGDV